MTDMAEPQLPERRVAEAALLLVRSALALADSNQPVRYVMAPGEQEVDSAAAIDALVAMPKPMMCGFDRVENTIKLTCGLVDDQSQLSFVRDEVRAFDDYIGKLSTGSEEPQVLVGTFSNGRVLGRRELGRLLEDYSFALLLNSSLRQATADERTSGAHWIFEVRPQSPIIRRFAG
jgi:hypothetical protein